MIERYKISEVEELLSDKQKHLRWLKIELTVLEYFLKEGRVEAKVLDYFRKNYKFKPILLKKLESKTKHDFFAFLESFSDFPRDYTKYLHFGLTSTDIVDTANSLVFKKINEIIIRDLDKLKLKVKELAYRFKDQACVGRTHGQSSEITSFGLKFAYFYDSLTRRETSFKEAAKEVEVAKISGVTGSNAHLPPDLQDFVADKLGLGSAAISTQVLSRDRHLNYFSQIANLASSISSFSLHLRLLSIEEVGEVSEAFEEGQQGSSAMPHKKNPISLENISGMCRLLNGFQNVAINNVDLWLERDISHSSNERILILDATSVIIYVLRKLFVVLENLFFNTKRMQENINNSLIKLVSQALVLKLTEKSDFTRLEAYEFIKKIFQNSNNIEKMKLKVKPFLPEKEILDCFNSEYYLKNIESIYRRVFGEKEEKRWQK